MCIRDRSHGFLTRDTRFSAVEPYDVEYFKKTLPEKDAVLTEKTLVEKYNEEYTHKYNGLSKCVLRPRTAQEISNILAYCNARKLAVVPQGGRTSLVAGGTSVFDEIVINLEKMNKIYELSPYTGILKLQAGVILENADKYCQDKGFLFPLDLGAKGSCQIGGNLGANAGGLHFIKYGSLHGNTIGMRVVLANGKILDTLDAHRKDNTGYDLKQLFIGAEGTLGIITDAAILCYPKPLSTSVCFLGIPSFDDIKAILIKAKQRFGENLSAIEMMDDQSYELIQRHIKSTRVPIERERYPFYMVIETHHNGPQAESDEKLMSFIETMHEHIPTGILSRDETQRRHIWSTRELIADAFVKEGMTFKYDVSLTVDQFYELVPILRERVGTRAVVGGYGHV
eukprot:TRINITY_DN2742_c0_g1_i2.p2 TRINITY_DN2742_c0_g1~~TRINITY_DN2742_c0_g1_i2.p2  ORF type:complete len:397 (+),score=83.97 TRINITY_DN2742_c0_g1_i2:64-1254(+)